MKIIHAFLFATSLGGIASAATIVQTGNYSFTPTGNQTLTFNKFDTMGGTRTLLNVTITTSVTKSGGSLYVDNDSASPASGSISQSVTINLSATGASLLNEASDGLVGSNVTANSFYSVSLSADDGDGAGYQAGGTDWGGTEFSDVTTSQSETAGSTASFVGSGTTFTIKASGTQATDTAAVSGVAGAFSPAVASGFVTVTYTYSVPEPAAALLGGLGLLTLLRRRRH